MLVKLSLWSENDCGNTPSVHVNPAHVASVQEWKTRQVSTVHMTTGEKFNVYDFGNVAKAISEAQEKGTDDV